MSYVNSWKITRNVKVLLSLSALLVLSLFGFKEKGGERHVYDVFSIGVAHAEVPSGGGYGQPSTSATSSAAGTAGVAGCDADAST